MAKDYDSLIRETDRALAIRDENGNLVGSGHTVGDQALIDRMMERRKAIYELAEESQEKAFEDYEKSFQPETRGIQRLLDRQGVQQFTDDALRNNHGVGTQRMFDIFS